MSYQTIHTTYGLNKIAEAVASSIPINLTHMAVGDGGGVAVTPSASQTALVNERFRTTINTVVQDPANPLVLYVEILIPAASGGWWIREFGIFDADGQLFAVGNFPDTYKTLPSDGAVNDLVVRAELIVSNASVITLQIDPAVSVATRQWVLQNITATALLPGGTTGQVLTKDSNLDGAFSWHTQGNQNVMVNTVEEVQTLAASQLTINMTQRTTLGLSVVVEGLRLPKRAGANGWQEGANNTQIILGGTTGGGYYPVGTEVTMLQNQPVSSLPDVLDASLNLSDVYSASAARTNLDVYSKAEADQKAPAGEVAHFARNTPPAGWLAANGAVVSRTTYAALFSAIGTAFNTGGEAGSDFRLPDLRGEFIRGWDNGRGADVGRAFGSYQVDAFQGHEHSMIDQANGAGGGYAGAGTATRTLTTNQIVQKSGYSVPRVADETRPRNVALLACIKF